MYPCKSMYVLLDDEKRAITVFCIREPMYSTQLWDKEIDSDRRHAPSQQILLYCMSIQRLLRIDLRAA